MKLPVHIIYYSKEAFLKCKCGTEADYYDTISPEDIAYDYITELKNNLGYLAEELELGLGLPVSYFKEEKESYFDKLKELNINIPNELYGTSFICFIAAINYFIENVKFTEELNIHDIFIFSTINEQNVIRRVD